MYERGNIQICPCAVKTVSITSLYVWVPLEPLCSLSISICSFHTLGHNIWFVVFPLRCKKNLWPETMNCVSLHASWSQLLSLLTVRFGRHPNLFFSGSVMNLEKTNRVGKTRLEFPEDKSWPLFIRHVRTSYSEMPFDYWSSALEILAATYLHSFFNITVFVYPFLFIQFFFQVRRQKVGEALPLFNIFNIKSQGFYVKKSLIIKPGGERLYHIEVIILF